MTIQMGKNSSLADSEAIVIKGGVKLTCFAPQKKSKYANLTSQEDDQVSEPDEIEKAKIKEMQAYEYAIYKREQDEQKGLLEPRQVTSSKE